MKEYRFKVLNEGDALYSFSKSEMVVKEENGGFRVYKLSGFDIDKPQFYKIPESLSVHSDSPFNEDTVIVEKSGKTVVYKIDGFKNKFPVLNQNFVVILSKGIGKIEVFDSETRITVQLPPKTEDL
ncbi:hypothetical protein J7I06_003321 [Vibrio vulnificus]|uniref:hypothetical protein n=1 Tax=Vibrio vulnificus TaxID=672 RepID=UPI000CD12D03|nr:hypothetical protein [Vibrio vulnificus]EHH0803950.1 hypothetical protein [Vibrio vulnificus]EHV5551902.1 hypothetical protein [Vibrio vulnificus]POC26264.1 hypothetical protein CRN42_04210 [Vibrio vulnificus]